MVISFLKNFKQDNVEPELKKSVYEFIKSSIRDNEGNLNKEIYVGEIS